MSENVLEISHFKMSLPINNIYYPVIDDISLYIQKGEMIALVGESGCGKTMTALSTIGLEASYCHIDSGTIKNHDIDVTEYSEKEWEKIRGNDISMIFQEPMTALDPLMTIGKQIKETAILHGINEKEARLKAIEMMKLVNLPDIERLYHCYPHQLSGGMRQRVMIALALINQPNLLIADEPTTALDVTIQAQIMALLEQMNQKTGTAILLITHDLNIVKQVCKRVYIMYAGKIIETGATKDLFEHPSHPYTKGLIASMPTIQDKGKDLNSIPGYVKSLQDRIQKGCPFYERCAKAIDACKEHDCILQKVDEGHFSACIFGGVKK